MPWLTDDDLVQIDLPTPGEWVKVKARLSVDDRLRITTAAMAGSAVRVAGNRALDGDFDLAAATVAMAKVKAEVAIKAWSSPLPVTPENIGRLDEESWAYLSARLDELYPGPREEPEKNASGGSGPTGRSGDARVLPQSSGGSR
jgi:hypothetical protein